MQGYFQALFSCIERVLVSLKIKNFVLPAAHEAEGIWMKKFGFSRIPPEEVNYEPAIQFRWRIDVNLIAVGVLQLEAYLNGAHLTIFHGTSYLYKAVTLS